MVKSWTVEQLEIRDPSRGGIPGFVIRRDEGENEGETGNKVFGNKGGKGQREGRRMAKEARYIMGGDNFPKP